MEPYQLTVDIIMLTLANPANKSLSKLVVSFLNSQDVKSLNQQLENSLNQSSFAQLIRTYYFLTHYLNKVDRTFYYSFYQEKQFRDIQISHTALLATNSSNCFLQFPKKYQNCLLFIQKLFPQHVEPTELASEILRMITDTDIPMPKLKRQNQGIFCRTAFQNYLIYLKFKNECFSDYEEVFENLNNFFEKQEQIYLQKLFLKATKDKNLNKKIRFIRFTPYQINYQNYKDYLVQKCSLHNFLVIIFTLTDVWLKSILAYIEQIQDPFHRYIELITRYSIYRNYVISVEENLSFAFQIYNELYCQVFGGGKPMYRFWRSAMAKWMIKFQKYHAECSGIYYYCLTKLRTSAAIKYLQQKQQQEPEIYMAIKNKMSLRQYEVEVNQTLIPGKISNGIEEFFQKDQEMYQMIIVEFMQYMIDLSINEESVHWCGHSQQIVSEPYISFEKYIMTENKMYLNYIRSLPNNKNKYTFSRQFYQQQIQFLQSVEFKPLTLKKIVESFNLQLSDQPMLSQQSMNLVYDFRTNDETLKYFNLKAGVKFQIPEQQKYFYSITPLVTAEELLTKSGTSTAYDSEAEEEGESECQEYFSNYASQDQAKKQCQTGRIMQDFQYFGTGIVILDQQKYEQFSQQVIISVAQEYQQIPLFACGSNLQRQEQQLNLKYTYSEQDRSKNTLGDKNYEKINLFIAKSHEQMQNNIKASRGQNQPKQVVKLGHKQQMNEQASSSSKKGSSKQKQQSICQN